MTTLRKLLLGSFSMLFIGTGAQSLHQDIEVEQKLTVNQRDASPLSVLPELTLPPLAPATLDYSGRVVPTKVPNNVTILEPVTFDDPALSTTHRGYVGLGFFPRYNLGVSAGYRAVSTKTTKFSIWGQYDGDTYRRDGWVDSEGHPASALWRDHTATVNLSLRHRLPRRQLLEISAGGLYGRHNHPAYLSSASQSAAQIDARVALSSLLGEMKWRIGAEYTYFGFGSISLPDIYIEPGQALTRLPSTPLRQHDIRLNAAASLPLGDHSSVGVDLRGEMLSSSDHLTTNFPFGYADQTYEFGSTAGLLRLTPYWRVSSATFALKAGAQLSATVNDGRAFHVAPEVSLAWTPSAVFGVEARAYGGSRLNPASRFYAVTPYLNAYSAYSQSNLPIVADLIISLGSFMGASLEASAGYAKATDWLMPVETGDTYGGLVLTPTDLKGWRWDIALAYTNGSNIEARVAYGRTPGGVTTAWYADLDRARSHADASVAFKPFPALRIEAAYHLRADRSMAITVAEPDIITDPSTGQPVSSYKYVRTTASLGNAADLSVGASYMINGSLTLFAQGRNLLNNSFLLLGGRPAQGITALVGAQFLF